MSFERLLPIWLAGGAAGATLYYLLHRDNAAAAFAAPPPPPGSDAEAKFIAALPSYGRKYGVVILRVAREENLPAHVLAALMSRESDFGMTLSPKGDPGGTGDFGHGRGLMQIDDRSNVDWLAANNWRDPYTNVKKGAQILKGKIAYLSSLPRTPTVTGRDGRTYHDPRPLMGDTLFKAAIAAYNTGELNALKSVAAGLSPDTTTTGKDYGADVLRRAERYAVV